MKNRITLIFLISIAFLSLVKNIPAQTTEFTYQGQLLNGGVPANGNYDFQFELYASPTGGTPLGLTLVFFERAVTNGTFAVRLNFGSQFPGANRYLEISVKPTGTDTLTTLSPRQLITSSPYSVQSLTATNAAQLGGVSANQYVLTTDSRLTDARNPLPNSTNYIQNSTTQQGESNFNISGNGTVGGTLSAGTVSAHNQYNLQNLRVLSVPAANLFVGINAGQSNAGSINTFVGTNAGYANTADNNAFLGAYSGQQNTGAYNSFFGISTGAVNQENGNSFFGYYAGNKNTSGYYNSFFGFLAGSLNTSGTLNTFFGASAGKNNTTAGLNSFFGNDAGRENTTGFANSYFGSGTGYRNTTGTYNSFFGQGSGGANLSGNRLTLLGSETDVGDGNLTNATAIGNRAYVSANNSLVLGSINGVNFATADTNVGIGTTAPLTRLDVRGSIFVGLTQSPSAAYNNSLFLANDGGDAFNNFRLDAASNNLYIIGRSALGAATGAGIIFRTSTAGNNETDRMTINPDGTVSLTVLGAAGSTQLCRNASNQISTCSSSIRYKTNINSFNSGLDLIRKLRPVSFNWKENNLADLGLVAEEVNKVEPLLTTTNEKGETEGVKYDRVGVVLVNAVQEQQTQIEEQQKQINEQKDLLQKQQTEIEALKLKLSEFEQLKQLVCAQNKMAPFCQPNNQ